MEPSQYKKQIGKRLAQARNALGLSLSQLEEASGGVFPKSTLGNYEQGTRTPGPWDIKALAELLGTRAAFLMCLEESQLVTTPEEEKLLRNLLALPENERVAFAQKVEVSAIRYRAAVPDQALKPKRREQHERHK